MGFKPGQSGNPRGRPKSGHSLAERIRAELAKPGQWDALIGEAFRLAVSAHDDTASRIKAMEWIAKHGFPEEKQRLEIDLPAAVPLFALPADAIVKTQ